MSVAGRTIGRGDVVCDGVYRRTNRANRPDSAAAAVHVAEIIAVSFRADLGWSPGPADRLELIQPIAGATLQACEKAAARTGVCLVDRLAGLRADWGEHDKRKQRREGGASERRKNERGRRHEADAPCLQPLRHQCSPLLVGVLLSINDLILIFGGGHWPSLSRAWPSGQVDGVFVVGQLPLASGSLPFRQNTRFGVSVLGQLPFASRGLPPSHKCRLGI